MSALRHGIQTTGQIEKLDVLLTDCVRTHYVTPTTGALAATLSRIDEAFSSEAKIRARIRR